MEMRYTKEELFEGTFTNSNNLDSHYNRHVLKQGEEFNPNDPKFPVMSKEEYAKRAQELSEMKAGPSDDRQSHVIGFELEFGGKARLAKFRKRCQDYPSQRFGEMVVYVDDETGNEVITYMVTRPGKIYRELSNYIDELPENRKEEEKTLTELFREMDSFRN